MNARPIEVSPDALEQLAFDTVKQIEFSATAAHLIHEGREYVAQLPSAVA